MRRSALSLALALLGALAIFQAWYVATETGPSDGPRPALPLLIAAGVGCLAAAVLTARHPRR